MKQNAKYLLLSLYVPESQNLAYGFSYGYFSVLFPYLSSGGVRSLMKRLFQDGWVNKITKNNRTYFSLTQAGRMFVLEEYPSVRQIRRKDSQQCSLILLSPPDQDPHFTDLRKVLTQYHSVRIARGAYLLTYLSASALTKSLLGTYNDSVVVCAVDEWIFGETGRMGLGLPASFEIIKLLSGVSSQIDRLTDNISNQKSLNKHQKAAFSSCFLDLVEVVGQSAVLSQHDLQVAELVMAVWIKWIKLVSVVFLPTQNS